MPAPKRLNERQRKFVAAYLVCGIAVQAAKQAGYSLKTAPAQSSRLLQNVYIQAAIQQQQQLARQQHIADRAERQQLWTHIASGLPPYHEATLRDRLKASELLGRSQADFIDRHEVTGKDGGPIQLGTTVVHELVTAPVRQLEGEVEEEE